jgi:hypothetical protein
MSFPGDGDRKVTKALDFWNDVAFHLRRFIYESKVDMKLGESV